MSSGVMAGQGKVPEKGSWLKKNQTQKRLFVILAVGPAFLAYLLFGIYPNILSVYYSLLQWDGITKPKFVGLFNYTEMITDRFMWRSLYHNLILVLIVPVVVVILSLVLADLLVNWNFRESKVYKVLFFFPNILSTIVIGLMWVFIYDGEFGLLNAMLKIIGIDTGGLYWLADERTALAAVIIPLIWSSAGFYIIIFMNAMVSIPNSLYESATMDGATNRVKLFQITLPLISGVIRVGLIFLFLNLLKGFEMIIILTRGGPAGATDVVGLYMFNYAFGSQYSGGLASATNYGYASAIGMFLFVLLVGLKVVTDKLIPEDNIEF